MASYHIYVVRGAKYPQHFETYQESVWETVYNKDDRNQIMFIITRG